ncbi:hypothetical protein H072_6629 [Dactylellina haptotyla CBS 200.50]|uniref:Uncharacterized protein n=1 Tax=Dactylellina haptotyla (strain CBS 200.50) TaxID=1284197 RepID=S8BW03_DACHA|nr:hypothetical protein H072_6629 [Dactylellina haptotyla CBS 200.50]
MQLATILAAATLLLPAVLAQHQCIQEWQGTAPFCNGKCLYGYREVGRAKVAGSCSPNTAEKEILGCQNTSKNVCWTGNKVLCEFCFA